MVGQIGTVGVEAEKDVAGNTPAPLSPYPMGATLINNGATMRLTFADAYKGNVPLVNTALTGQGIAIVFKSPLLYNSPYACGVGFQPSTIVDWMFPNGGYKFYGVPVSSTLSRQSPSRRLGNVPEGHELVPQWYGGDIPSALQNEVKGATSVPISNSPRSCDIDIWPGNGKSVTRAFRPYAIDLPAGTFDPASCKVHFTMGTYYHPVGGADDTPSQKLTVNGIPVVRFYLEGAFPQGVPTITTRMAEPSIGIHLKTRGVEPRPYKPVGCAPSCRASVFQNPGNAIWYIVWEAHEVTSDAKVVGPASSTHYNHYDPAVIECPLRNNYCRYREGPSSTGTYSILNQCGPSNAVCLRGVGTPAQTVIGSNPASAATRQASNELNPGVFGGFTPSASGQTTLQGTEANFRLPCSASQACPSGYSCCASPGSYTNAFCYNTDEEICDVTSGTPQVYEARYFLPETTLDEDTDVAHEWCVNVKTQDSPWDGKGGPGLCNTVPIVCPQDVFDNQGSQGCIDYVLGKVNQFSGLNPDAPACPGGTYAVGTPAYPCDPRVEPNCKGSYNATFNYFCQPTNYCTDDSVCAGGTCQGFQCVCDPSKTGQCPTGLSCDGSGVCVPDCGAEGFTSWKDSCVRLPPLPIELTSWLSNDSVSSVCTVSSKPHYNFPFSPSCSDVGPSSCEWTGSSVAGQIKTAANQRGWNAVCATDTTAVDGTFPAACQVFFKDTMAEGIRPKTYYYPPSTSSSLSPYPHQLPILNAEQCVPADGNATCQGTPYMFYRNNNRFYNYVIPTGGTGHGVVSETCSVGGPTNIWFSTASDFVPSGVST